MNGKKREISKYLIISFLSVFLIGGIFILSINTLFAEGEKEKETPTDSSNYTSNEALSQGNSESMLINSAPQSTNKPLYTVKEYNGVIGVFNYGESEPFLTENKRISNLPERDRLIIKNGRDFYSYREMLEFVMDYE